MVDLDDQRLYLQGKINYPVGTVALDAARDKSLTHRAYMFAALAEGTSRVLSPLASEDCLATLAIVEALGVEVQEADGVVQLRSPGPRGWKLGDHRFDFGNSGTTARLMLGLFAGIDGFAAEVTGDASLRTRPMGRVTEPLTKMGARLEFADRDGYLPLRLFGRRLEPQELRATKASAQIKSALLLAALNTRGRTSIRLPAGGRDHTEKFLLAQGLPLTIASAEGDEILTLEGPCSIKPFSGEVPRDPSSAAFLWALPLVHGRGGAIVRDVLSNPTRIGFLDCIRTMGARVIKTAPRGPEAGYIEEVATFEVQPPASGPLRPLRLGADEVPACIDEIPILAVVAAFAAGASRFEGLDELRLKESDRLAATEQLLRMAGVTVRSGDNWLEIEGSPQQAGRSLPAYDPRGDHRLAMAAAVLGTKFTAEIKGAQCVHVSFPSFFEILGKLG